MVFCHSKFSVFTIFYTCRFSFLRGFLLKFIASYFSPQICNALRPFSCHLCPNTFTKLRTVKTHIGVLHLQKKLTKFCAKNDNTCTLCQKKYASKSSLLDHLIHNHKVLDKFIPSEDRLKIGNVLPKGKKKSQSPSREETVKRSALRTDDYRCYRCPSRFDSRNKLFRHIACSHFRKKLTERYQKGEHQV